MRSSIVAAVLWALAALPCDAAAGVIRGRLWLSAELAGQAVAPTPGRVNGTVRTASAQPGITDAVIYVTRVPEAVERKLSRRGWFAPKPRLPRIVQTQLRFQPRVLVTPAGDRVELKNLDRVYHNAFSVSAALRFDLGKYPPGHVDTLTFNKPGAVNLHCDIHPDEIGYVVVTPNHAYARPDSLGRFSLPKLPPGEYSVKIWHPALGERTRRVEMPKRGNLALEVMF